MIFSIGKSQPTAPDFLQYPSFVQTASRRLWAAAEFGRHFSCSLQSWWQKTVKFSWLFVRFCFHVCLQIQPLNFDCGPENHNHGQTSFQSKVHRLHIEFCVHILSEYLLTTNCCWSQSLQNKLILRWFICILLWTHSMPTCCTKVADTSRGIWTLALNSSREMKRGPQDGNSFKVDLKPSPLSQRGSKVSSSLVAAGKKFSTGGVSRPSSCSWSWSHDQNLFHKNEKHEPTFYHV